MKNSSVKYVSDWKHSPMAYWVHIEKGDKPWRLSEEFEPPAPKRFGNFGYPQLVIEFNGHWISRLPGKTKPWRYREKLVEYCKKIDFPKSN